ncbi:complement C4-like [Rhinatrema bivittatum]|uniref:complement C4-like n=1 Tax=Rhinatrema bivittatum TaxID=194408 RepID=UPI00112A324A|nr:complement C4-like [Rhinatrema bivittatum]
MELPLWTTCCSLLLAVSHQSSPPMLITAPNIIHVGVEESIAVQAWEGVPEPTTVKMHFLNQRTNLQCSGEQTFTLSSTNAFIQIRDMKITPASMQQCGIGQLRTTKYVQLVAKSPALPGGERLIPILLSTRRGYLFIQTDKSIYTPGQKVQFRVFTLDHVMRPSSEPVTIRAFNAQGLQVFTKEQIVKNSIINQQIIIPDISEPGIWRITAQFTSALESNASAEFEVRKYVLPNFEVKILPKMPYYDLNAADFTFTVEARYVYSESVNGLAYLRFGVTDEDGKRTFLRGTEKQIKLENGKADVSLTTAEMSGTLGQPLMDLRGHSLYIAVTVVEIATGALEEQELSTVKFVTSPYAVGLSKTKRYFVPGVPFLVVATVTHADGSPATEVSTQMSMAVAGGPSPEPQSQTTDERGVATFHVNLARGATSLAISVKAGDSPEASQAVVTRYESGSGSYLNIDVPYRVVRPQEFLPIDLKDITASGTSIPYFYYVVLNKGKILSLQRVQNSGLTKIQLPITEKMIPAFRFLAYYRLGDEIVANSIWVDVVDSCQGKLLVSTENTKDLLPGGHLRLSIETDDEATVSLAAVDSAVYILNKKNRLTPNKVFQAMNSYDLGCTMGSGKDFRSVFQDAGLAFDSGTAGSTIRRSYGCESDARRRKRSLEFGRQVHDKVNEYTDPRQQRCCRDGMSLLPRHMKRTCDQRASRVRESTCRDAFLHCCTYATDLRKKRVSIAGLGRKYTEEEDEDFLDEGSIQSRTYFPESWMWKTVTVNKRATINEFVPDSITTWEIQAVSMSVGRGICIAEPAKVKVFKPFHIYLRLPYSVKRFEQLEIRPVLYNYLEGDINVRVHMEQTEGICSPATATGPKIQSVLVPGSSAVPVPFSIVPMGKLDLPVTVEARGPLGLGDRITKVLHIVREGVSKLEEKTYQLDTGDDRGRSLHIPGEIPSNLIPDADFSMSVRVSADSTLETINNSLAADGVSRLIRVPTGCAEQTMIYMAPSAYAMKYLDETEQWINLNPERKTEALKSMESGYTRILSYQKEDGSYGAWISTPSSTWLTAFVVKILSLCREYMSVDDAHIRKAVTFLLSHQRPSGEFYDPHPVYHREMQGGVGGLEGDVTLTSFVTIALHHALPVYKEDANTLKESIQVAARFLEQRLLGLSRPYAIAISAYALSLVSNNQAAKDEAHSLLMDNAKEIPDLKALYWESKDKFRLVEEKKADRVPAASAISVEATAYALMHVLLRNDMPMANKIVRWLTEQQNYGGGFKSTQDTVVSLEAFSQYWIKTFSNDVVDLAVTVSSPGRQAEKKIQLQKSGNQIQEELQVSLGNALNVKVEGQGKGTLTILKLYRVLQVENNTCQHMKLEVDVSGEVKYSKEITEDYEYDYGEEPAEEPLSRIQLYDLRRQRRSAPRPERTKDKSVFYTVCLSRDPQARLSGMAIADITMLSGFEPSFEDLNRLKDLSDRYISHYEYQFGRIILYFEEVPVERDCIAFEAIQKVPIGLLQPASAILYDFYDPDQKCSVSYSAPQKSKFVSTLCSQEVCQCAEGPCPHKRKTKEITEENTDPRLHHACYSPRVKYGYKVRVTASAEKDAFVVYEGRVGAVLQRTKDETVTGGATRHFVKRRACKMELEAGKEYLIMGEDGDTQDPEGRPQYLLEATSWVEELLSETQCRATRYQNACSQARTFMESYRNNGCMV